MAEAEQHLKERDEELKDAQQRVAALEGRVEAQQEVLVHPFLQN